MKQNTMKIAYKKLGLGVGVGVGVGVSLGLFCLAAIFHDLGNLQKAEVRPNPNPNPTYRWLSRVGQIVYFNESLIH